MWRAPLPQGRLASASCRVAAGTTHPDVAPVSLSDWQHDTARPTHQRPLSARHGSEDMCWSLCDEKVPKHASCMVCFSQTPALQFARVKPKRIEQAVKLE